MGREASVIKPRLTLQLIAYPDGAQASAWTTHTFASIAAFTHTSATELAPIWRSHEEAVIAADTGVASGALLWPAGLSTRVPRGEGVLNPAAGPRDSGPGPGGES